jgi:hypothetical protein
MIITRVCFVTVLFFFCEAEREERFRALIEVQGVK